MVQDVKRDPEWRRAMDLALGMLARRDHACGELGRKLRQKGVDPATVGLVLAECRRLGYADDARTAEGFAKALDRRGYGPRYIRHALAGKGLSRTLVDGALLPYVEADREWAAAVSVLKKNRHRFQPVPDRIKRKAKMVRFLLARGFRPDAVSRAAADAETAVLEPEP